MFTKSFYERLRLWRHLRNEVETSENPYQMVLDFWASVPLSSRYADPYDSSSWPDPWELIHQNVYCEFLQLLAVCYTLQLTERFSHSDFEIHITLDKKNDRLVYLLFVDNHAIGYYNNGCINANDIQNLVCQMHHVVNLCHN